MIRFQQCLNHFTVVRANTSYEVYIPESVFNRLIHVEEPMRGALAPRSSCFCSNEIIARIKYFTVCQFAGRNVPPDIKQRLKFYLRGVITRMPASRPRDVLKFSSEHRGPARGPLLLDVIQCLQIKQNDFIYCRSENIKRPSLVTIV